MAHIVCLTSGLTGILYAGFELVQRLQRDGHRLTYGCPVDRRAEVEAQGITYVQLPAIPMSPEPEVPSFSGPFGKVKRWQYKLSNRKERQEQAIHTIGHGAILDLLEKLAPDLLIIDVELHEYILTAFAEKRSFVILSQWFSLWERPGLPYLLHDTIPGRGWKGSQMAMAWSWRLVRWQRYWGFAKKKLFSGGTDRRSTLLRLADQLHFPRHFIRENYWPGPFSYNTLPVWSMTAWEMEFPHDKRENLEYIGPMIYTDRRDPNETASLHKELESLFTRKKNEDLRLIYCSVSSLKSGDEAFLRKVCRAVQGQSNWLLVISLGGLIDQRTLEHIPENVHVYPWLPQLKMLEQADCSINHGGIHTINECLHFGVPMLVYSGKRSDQNGCAARVAYHQLGLIGDKDRDTVAQIREKIQLVLTDDKIQSNMALMQEHCRRYQNERCVEQRVATLISAKTAETAPDRKPLAG